MAGVAGRVALVTGAGSRGGIGFAIARALAGAGARVAVTSTTARIHERAGEIGAMGHVADLTDPGQVAGVFTAVEAALGPVEILVNNAGMVQSGRDVGRARLAGWSDADWAHHMALNLGTTFHCCRAALPGMAAQRGDGAGSRDEVAMKSVATDVRKRRRRRWAPSSCCVSRGRHRGGHAVHRRRGDHPGRDRLPGAHRDADRLRAADDCRHHRDVPADADRAAADRRG